MNLFADMGSQPTTLMSGLAAATKSNDTTGPTTTITSPGERHRRQRHAGDRDGTASDAGGGRSRRSRSPPTAERPGTPPPAPPRGATVRAARPGLTSRSRCAPSTTAPTSAPPAPVTRRVTCPCTVYGAAVPAVPDSGDASGVELGLRFTPTSDGFVERCPLLQGDRQHRHARGHPVDRRRPAAGHRDLRATRPARAGRRSTFAVLGARRRGTTYVVSYRAPERPLRRAQRRPWSQGIDADAAAGGGRVRRRSSRRLRDPGTFPTQSYQARAVLRRPGVHHLPTARRSP